MSNSGAYRQHANATTRAHSKNRISSLSGLSKARFLRFRQNGQLKQKLSCVQEGFGARSAGPGGLAQSCRWRCTCRPRMTSTVLLVTPRMRKNAQRRMGRLVHKAARWGTCRAVAAGRGGEARRSAPWPARCGPRCAVGIVGPGLTTVRAGMPGQKLVRDPHARVAGVPV